MATYLADRVIVFEGQPAITATATPPQSLLTGMNRFLASLEITFRRDPTNFRPRVNKKNSVKDREQKCTSFSLLPTYSSLIADCPPSLWQLLLLGGLKGAQHYVRCHRHPRVLLSRSPPPLIMPAT
jgi:hypothetical protein